MYAIRSYYESIFEEYNLEIPTTWDEFINAAVTIKNGGKYIPIGLGAKDAWADYPYNEFMPLVEAKNGALWNAMAAMDEPFSPGEPFYEAYKKIQKLYDAKVFGDDPLGISFDQIKVKFYVITSYSIHYTKLYDISNIQGGGDIGMSRINKYIKSFLMGFEEAMQYRTNFILGILSTIFPITIQVYIWKAVFMNDSEKLVYGFSYKQIIVYTLLSAIVAKFVSSGGFEWEVNDDIKNGGLNKYLVKPVGYFNYRICCALGKKIPQSTVIFILICIILAISGSIFGNSINALRITVFIVSLILAIVLNMLIIYCFSMVAFWISDAGSFFVISGIIINILSGGIFPLEIFGVITSYSIHYTKLYEVAKQ